METKRPKAQDYSKMKLSELIRYDYDDSDSDIDENDPLLKIWNDENYESPESDNANSDTYCIPENEAKETYVEPMNLNPDFVNQLLVELKPIDEENTNQQLKTTFESEENKTEENADLNRNISITVKRKPKPSWLRTKEYRERLKAKRAKSLPATLNIETQKTDLQNKPIAKEI